MTSKKMIDEFLRKKNIAVVGVSRKKGKFGNVIYRELKKKGFNVFPVNPVLDQIDGDKCYGNLSQLKGEVDALISVVPGNQTEKIVIEANEIGIKHIWMQQGSESESAIEYCKNNGMIAIHKQCVLMFADPVKTIHGFHKWLWKVLGKLPN